MKKIVMCLIGLCGIYFFSGCATPPMPPMHAAAKRGDIVAMQQLLNENGASILSEQYQGFNPLYSATPAAARFLIANGADINEENTYYSGASYGGGGWTRMNPGVYTLLTFASGQSAVFKIGYEGSYEWTKLLIELGADVNKAPSNKGWTPLQYATYYGFAGIVELLLNAGADPRLTTPHCCSTPAQLANKKLNVSLAKRLRGLEREFDKAEKEKAGE